jgi:hypothetical protein
MERRPEEFSLNLASSYTGIDGTIATNSLNPPVLRG